MKKIAITILLVTVFLIGGISGISEAADVAFTPAITGDLLYSLSEGKIVPVVSMQLATLYDGLVETRVMAVGDAADLTKLDKVGIGVGVNLVKLTDKLGQSWTAKMINPTVGIAPIYSFSTRTASIGIYVSIIKIEF